jgi:hypothetical protein
MPCHAMPCQSHPQYMGRDVVLRITPKQHPHQHCSPNWLFRPSTLPQRTVGPARAIQRDDRYFQCAHAWRSDRPVLCVGKRVDVNRKQALVRHWRVTTREQTCGVGGVMSGQLG